MGGWPGLAAAGGALRFTRLAGESGSQR